MFVGAQISLHPMTDGFVGLVTGALGALDPHRERLRIGTDDIPTLLVGPPEALFPAMRDLYARAAATRARLELRDVALRLGDLAVLGGMSLRVATGAFVATSADVNAHLREVSGRDVTAKDFRTWAGTVLAALALQAFEAVDGEAKRKGHIRAAIEPGAARPGDTPTICRRCHVGPLEKIPRLSGRRSSRRLRITPHHEAAVLTPPVGSSSGGLGRGH